MSSGMFQDSEIESVVIPEGVKEIKSSAFHGCTDLEQISLPGVTGLIYRSEPGE